MPIIRVSLLPICFISAFCLIFKTTLVTIAFCVVIFEALSVISILYMGVSKSERDKILAIVKRKRL